MSVLFRHTTRNRLLYQAVTYSASERVSRVDGSLLVGSTMSRVGGRAACGGMSGIPGQIRHVWDPPGSSGALTAAVAVVPIAEPRTEKVRDDVYNRCE